MIIADTITCSVPSDTAMKINELFCTVSNPVDSADSQTWATWASAVCTLGLLIFAIAAWLSSRKQIDLMRRESCEANNRNRDQIKANNDLEDQRNLDISMFDYLGAHADVFASGAGSYEDLRTAGSVLRKTSMRFIILRAFSGRSGEITNLDDLAIKLSEASIERPHDGDLWFGRNRLFNGVHSILRDLYDRRLGADRVHGEFQSLFVEIVKEYDIYLDPKYVKLVSDRGWLD